MLNSDHWIHGAMIDDDAVQLSKVFYGKGDGLLGN